MTGRPAVVIVAPNSFERFGQGIGVPSSFRLFLTSGRQASLSNLQQVFDADDPDRALEPDWDYHNPMAGYYLESFLKQHGFGAQCVFDWNDDEALLRAMRSDPIAVCFSTTYIVNNLTLAAALAALREAIGTVPIIVGGPYIWSQHLQYGSAAAANAVDAQRIAAMHAFGVDIMKDFLFTAAAPASVRDAIYVVSEFGEFTLLRVLGALERGSAGRRALPDIPNLMLAEGDTAWHATSQQPEPVDLNIHFTRWDLVDQVERDWLPIRTSVGCPYRCRYCDFIEMHPEILMRTPASLMEEFRLAQGRGVSDFYFIDDNIFLTKRRLAELAETILGLGMDITWGGHFRVDRVDDGNIDLIARSGARLGQCGVESFDQGQLTRMRKGCKPERSIRGIDLCSSRGMRIFLNLIIGYPGETRETLDTTIAALNDLDVDQEGFPSLEIFPLVVIPNTELDRPHYRREHDLRGRFGGWSHRTMTAEDAGNVWAPYLFRHSVPTSTHGKDRVPAGWSVARRNAALAARKSLILAFADCQPDAMVQRSFEALYHICRSGPSASAPRWSRFIAGRDRQADPRNARPEMMYGVENTLEAASASPQDRTLPPPRLR